MLWHVSTSSWATDRLFKLEIGVGVREPDGRWSTLAVLRGIEIWIDRIVRAVHHMAWRLISCEASLHATLLLREGTRLLLLGIVGVRLLRVHHHTWVSLVLHDHIVALSERLLSGIRDRPSAHLIEENSVVLCI